jgi:hypothetical protein
MKTDPPTGDGMTEFLSGVKRRVLTEAAASRPKKKRFGLATLALGGIGVLALGTAGTAIATTYMSDVRIVPIPHSTNRPADPPPPADYDQETNNALEPHEASLGQLWAGVNSFFDGSYGTDGSGSNASWTPQGMTDFSTAITDRCYPLRTAEEVAELDQLRVAYEAQSGEAGHILARAYFERATELCM